MMVMTMSQVGERGYNVMGRASLRPKDDRIFR